MELIYAEAIIIMTGRLLGTLGLIGLLKLCKYEQDHPTPVTFKELLFIWYAGLIRGAIAFGLVLRIDSSFENRNVIVTTCLTLVLFTTIFFGSTVGLLSKCLFRKPSADVEAIDPDLNSSVSSVSTNRSELVHPNLLKSDNKSASDVTGKQAKQQTLVEPLVGSDSAGQKGASKKPYKVGCSRYLQRFDEHIMKPLFIYKYHRLKA